VVMLAGIFSPFFEWKLKEIWAGLDRWWKGYDRRLSVVGGRAGEGG